MSTGVKSNQSAKTVLGRKKEKLQGIAWIRQRCVQRTGYKIKREGDGKAFVDVTRESTKGEVAQKYLLMCKKKTKKNRFC